MPPGVAVVEHVHEQPHVCFLLEGHFRERVDGNEILLPEGSLRLSPTGTSHDIQAGLRGARLLILHLGRVESAIRDHLERLGSTRILRRFSAASTALALAEFVTAGGAVSPARAVELARVMLAQGVREATFTRRRPPPTWLMRARASIQNSCPNVPSVREMAGTAGVHRVQFSRAFRDHFGATVASYVRGRRVDHAWHLLRETDKPLSLVAFEAGFADQSHMCRVLRGATGLSPGAVRARGPSPAPSWNAFLDATYVQDHPRRPC